MDAMLKRLAESVTGTEDLETLTRPMLELLQAVTGLDSTYLTTIDEREGVQRIQFSRNARQMQIPEGLAVPWGDTLCKRALEEGKPFTDDVAACWGDSGAARELGIRTYVSQPVHTVDGKLYGTLCGASATQLALPPETLRVLKMFAKLIAQQVDRERLIGRMQDVTRELTATTLTDPLTGIANRRAMEQELQRMLAAAARSGDFVQVAFVDLDGFKAINDQYGHDAGDRLLIQMAWRLTAAVRPADRVARTGGDEFVVLAMGEGAPDLGERLTEATRGRFNYAGGSFEYAGASVGVAASTPREADASALLARADAAMYEIKRARKGGRN